MTCPSCHSENDEEAAACFTCGKALFALTQGVLLAGRYEILRPLGKGGMGRVYKAYDQVLEESVALKVLRSELTSDPEMERRFRSEIRLARKVSHRNVCRIYEYGDDAGLSFISMEYIEGANLKDHLRGRPLPPRQAYDLVLQIADGLQSVHEHGIIHRDFKAANVMIDSRGLVKLMDFGIAKEAAGQTTGITGSGVIGTPEYMSPEQASGGKVDFRSDIYSLGCVIFEVFTGHSPFRGETPLSVMYKHQHEPPPLESGGLPDPLVPLLRVALAKDPAGRFASVAELAEALRRAKDAGSGPPPGTLAPTEGGDGSKAPETRTLPRFRKRERGHGRQPGSRELRLWRWAGGVVLLAAAALALRSELRRAPAPGPASVASPPASVASSPRPEPVTLAPVRAPSPLTAAPTAPAPTLRRDASPAAKPAPTPAPDAAPRAPIETSPQPEAAPAEPASGTLALLVVPPAEVSVDGRSIGVVSMRELPLSEGPHVLRILHPDFEPLQRKVHVRAGASSKLILDLAEKAIRKSP